MVEKRHILISSDFYPFIGGAHTWMYEVYSRWPETVIVCANDYSQTDIEAEQSAFDAREHGALRIHRFPIQFPDINVLDRSFRKHLAEVATGFKRVLPGRRAFVLHNLRAFPDGILSFYYKYRYNRSCRIVTYVHGEELNVADSSGQIKLLAKWVISRSDLVIVNSAATEKRLTSFLGRKINVHVTHPGVDSALYCNPSVERTALRERWGMNQTDIVLVTMARLELRKNHRMVLQVMAELVNHGIPLRYIIGSDGEQRQMLERYASELGISDQVIFTGFLDDREKRSVYSLSDIHIMPSISHGHMVEGFGIVFLEAGAAGLPSISGISGGQAEAVRHGETGFTVDGTDREQVMDALVLLARDSDLRKKMGSAGRAWARKNDWACVSDHTWKLSETFLGSNA